MEKQTEELKIDSPETYNQNINIELDSKPKEFE